MGGLAGPGRVLPTYSIAEIDVTVSYSYVQSRQTFSA